MRLFLNFEAGFDQDTVFVQWAAKKYIFTNLSTDFSAGLAHSIELDVQHRKAMLIFNLPEKGLTNVIEIEPDKDLFVTVNITPDNLLETTISSDEKIYF